MITHHSILLYLWRLKFYICLGLNWFLMTQSAYSEMNSSIDMQNIVLQGSIFIEPIKNIPGDQTNKIQPGTAVKISVNVENKGQQISPQGQLSVRYAFTQPLDKEIRSIIFETEKKSLPSIEPGKVVEIAFDCFHQIPSLVDFIRDDWSIREYQALAFINQQEYLIGTLALTFSAYYYSGVKKELPTSIRSTPI